ncbi:hypothetical protein [Oceanobacillus kapialis]|uniref:Uncharacterized protein n=1 Tax=Oceanobacillus kapialis TaxID=481353 RepID=A0ABW5PWQ0_9BACI
MSHSDGYRKFQIVFHLIIAIIASIILYTYAVDGFQVAYVIIAGVIGVSSIFQLVLLLRRGSKAKNQTSH